MDGRWRIYVAATAMVVGLLAAPSDRGVSIADSATHRVNAGGPGLSGTPLWAGDGPAAPSPYVNTSATGNATYATTQPVVLGPSVPQGTPPALFQTERWDPPGGSEMTWRFPVSPGPHEVRLYFAETFPPAQRVGARRFDVVIDGTVVLDDFDAFREAGANVGLMRSFTVHTGSALTIEFRHVVENPSVKAIEVLPMTRPGWVSRQGGTLMLDGRPYRFTGLNAYGLTTWWRVNRGCGAEVPNVDAFLGSLRPSSMVRVWAFQDLAQNRYTGARDFAAIDRVVTAAERTGQKLIVTLADHWGRCDGPAKDGTWYGGGYRTPQTGDGVVRVSYWDWVREIVARYRNSPAVGMWEPVNEPELTCAEPASILRHFFDAVGSEVKRLDPNHLVSSGTQGGGQCGLAYGDYEYVHASPGIDVVSYHDYHHDAIAVPGDQWNGLAVHLEQARRLARPLIVGETGLWGGDAPGCPTLLQRRDRIRNKLDGQFAAGVQGFVLWHWVERPPAGCTYAVAPSDPALEVLRTHPL